MSRAQTVWANSAVGAGGVLLTHGPLGPADLGWGAGTGPRKQASWSEPDGGWSWALTMAEEEAAHAGMQGSRLGLEALQEEAHVRCGCGQRRTSGRARGSERRR